MYIIDRTIVPGEASERTAAPLQLVEQTPIAPAAIVRAGSTEPEERHHDQECDPNFGPKSPPSQLPLDNARQVSGHHKRDDTEGLVDASEPGETRAFLDKDRSKDGSSHDTKTRIKISRAKLLAAWWTEVAALAGATAALIAIVTTLARYNNKEQPNWKGAINLNTLIAILSTLMRACMVVVAEEVISQLKWLFIRQPRPVQNLAQFDTASRGPWGSVLSLFRTRRMNTAILGSVIIAFSVGVGPFTQQAVKAVSCERPLDSGEASIRISRWMSSNRLARIDVPHWEMDMDTKVAIMDGLANPNTTRSMITPECSTGKCSFPAHNGVTHSSVGMCSKCVNIAPWVSEVRKVRQYQNGTSGDLYDAYVRYLVLPSGRGIGGADSPTSKPDHIIDVSGFGTVFKDPRGPFNDSLLEAFDDSFTQIFRASILNVSAITFTNNNCDFLGPHERPGFKCSDHAFNATFPFLDYLDIAATACSFYPCVRDYHGSVNGTVFEERVVKETPITQPQGQMGNMFPHFMRLHTPCLVDSHVYTMDNISLVPKDGRNFTNYYVDQINMTFPVDCAYGVDGVYALSLVDFMYETIFGNCTVPSRINFDGDSDDYNSVKCTPWYLKGLVNKGNASFESIDRNMQSIAIAATSEMRKQGTDQETRFDPKEMFAKGTVIRTTVCTRFDWKWLSFPLVLTLLAILLLSLLFVKTMFDAQGIPAWKSSVLPLLLVGNQIGASIRAEEVDAIKKNTNNVIVHLAHLDRGWELVVDDVKKDS